MLRVLKMRQLVLLSLAIVALIPAGTSLRCHSCKSLTGDLECFQERKSEDCYPGKYSCAKASYRLGEETNYFRGCQRTDQCTNSAYCTTHPEKTKCKIICCDSDLCNDGSRNMISGAVLVICTFINFFFLWK